MIVHSPEGRLVQRVEQPEQRLVSLQGLRIGLLDNNNGHTEEILHYLGARLQERFPGVQVLYRSKKYPSVPVPDEVAAELRTATDVVINGLGD